MRHAGDMHLPGPLRAAVGLAATAATEAKHLPDRAVELPMLVVSSALQASLRAQQRYARLTARGDEVLNRRPPTAEPPPWATFDDPVPLEDLRRTVGGPAGGFGGDAPAEAASLLTQLFGVEDPTVAPDGREPVDEIPAYDEPPLAPVTDLSAEAGRTKARKPAGKPAAKAAKKAATKAAKKAAKNAVKPAKKAPTKPATRSAAAAKTTGKSVAKSAGKGVATTSGKSVAKSAGRSPATSGDKTVSKPRHTAPSAFDDAGD